MPRRLVPFAVFALLLLTPLGAPAAPVSRLIAIDGSFDDWTEVLASPENVARDGDGASLACASSTDGDCPVASPRSDIARFAWTWDDRGFAFLLERYSEAGTREHAWIYFDEDHDGLMESGEAVLHAVLDASAMDAAVEMNGYLPLLSAGDALADGSGRADGWTMPGRTSSGSGSVTPLVIGDAPGGARWEGLVPWRALGAGPGDALGFHVSLGETSTLPSGIEDNIGGPSGPGDTGYRAVRIDAPHTLGALPGESVTLRHAVTSAGNVAAHLGLRATSSSGLDLTWMRDYDGDGIAETLLAIDAGGDGSFASPADLLTPEGDTDGDGALDTGLLGAAQDARLEIGLDIPAGARGMKETVTLETWVSGRPDLRATVSDVVRAGSVTLARDVSRQSAPGETAWAPHVVSENTGMPAMVSLSAFSVRGWRWDFWLDPNGDGDPSDATRLPDLDGDGRADIALAPSETRFVFAAGPVPAGALIGTTETAIVRLHLNGLIESTVTDRVLVSPALDVAPNHLLSDGQARYGGDGEPIYFAHRITNATGRLTSFRLDATCDAGWPVSVMLDPDGDGRPGDAVPAGPLVNVPVSGGTLPLLLRVDVPHLGRVVDQGRLSLTATAFDDARVTATALDDAIVALVRIYDDPSATFNVSLVPDCATAHVVATGLPPATPGFRFAWRDPSGLVIRLQDAASDATGRSSDTLVLRPSDLGPGFVAEIQQWNGVDWLELDSAMFAVGNEVSAAITSATPVTDLSTGALDVVVTAVNDSFDQTVATTIGWRLRSPDGGTVLDATGAFVPFTGTESTRTATTTLPPRDTVDFTLGLRGVAFPVTGTWRVEACRVSTCGGETLVGVAEILVTDDADGDGIERVDEMALGTSPTDADTDDDGLPDGTEGAEDTDGDGLADAVECDADGDGLPDGLEAGVTAPARDTDVAAGCFRADADPSTTTNPRDADSDDGGVSDGGEDPDGDGARQSRETDASEPADDWPACSRATPAEIEGLRVTKAAGSSARLTWQPTTDPCVAYVVEAADLLQWMSAVSPALGEPAWVDGEPLPSFIRYYLVRGDSWLGGRGPNGM